MEHLTAAARRVSERQEGPPREAAYSRRSKSGEGRMKMKKRNNKNNVMT